MSVKRFSWHDVASENRVVELAAGVGLTLNSAERRQVQLALGAILEKTGGLPITDSHWSDAKQKRVVRICVSEACRHFLTNIGARADYGKGYQRRPSASGPWEEDIVLCDRIALNTASATTLEQLPGIGQHLADTIVADRLKRGPFTSVADLAERIDGIGDETADAIRPCVNTREPISQLLSLSADADLNRDLRACIRIVSSDHDAPGFLRALEQIAIEAARRPHPTFRYGLQRHFDDDDGLTYHDIGVGVLINTDYYHHLQDALDSAQNAIDICMFHIALPEPSHPTHVLLEKLRAAHDRGVHVRVLLDRDRPEDPFESTLINSAAREWLTDQGIDCRFDLPEQLLHSKFVLIDASVAIIGSHNWSAGSYFVFDDLSVTIHSIEFVQALTQKFEHLWSTAQ